MKTLIKISCLVLGLATLLGSCDGDKSLPTTEGPATNYAYIEEAISSNSIRFTVGEEGGATFVTPRITNRVDQEVKLQIAVDAELLAEYNKANGTNFKLLPDANYDLVVGEKQAKSFDITLAPQEYGKAVTVKIHSMLDAEGNTVALTNSYAIPVRVKSVEGAGVKLKTKDTSMMVFVDRRFKTSVLYLRGRMLCEVKESTNDKKYSEWTAQYSFCPNEVNNNVGLMYPNTRESSDSPLYMSLSGGGFLLHANTGGGGKIHFNQPKFVDFKFSRGVWYHMSIVYKEEESVPKLRIYINGELALENIWPGKVADWPKIYIGNANFDAYVRELRFWERALTEAEVNSTLYFADPEAPGLELYMPFDKLNRLKNITPGKSDWFKVSFDSGASENSINFNNEVTFP